MTNPETTPEASEPISIDLTEAEVYAMQRAVQDVQAAQQQAQALAASIAVQRGYPANTPLEYTGKTLVERRQQVG